METRRYVAKSVAEGLLAVRQDLGAEAMILSVKEDKDPMSGMRRQVEITAQTARAQASPRPAGKARPEELLESIYAAQGEAPAAPDATPRRRRVQIADGPRPNLSLRAELGRLLPVPPAGGDVATLFFYLLDIGIDREIAEEMLERLCREQDPRRGLSKTRAREFLCKLVEREVACGGAFRQLRKSRVAAFIGPTGVGKTTTIAKLAARLTRASVSVGLITIDNFRVGAFDQLKKFATTLNVPLLAVANKADFLAALRVFKPRQAVLIDTTGQNPRDYEVLDRLNDTLRAAEGIERHLVLAAPTKERDQLSFIELYRKIGFHYMIFSKLDETATHGGLLNSYFAADRPFSYFTMGQRVPEDIAEASTGQICDLLFN